MSNIVTLAPLSAPIVFYWKTIPDVNIYRIKIIRETSPATTILDEILIVDHSEKMSNPYVEFIPKSNCSISLLIPHRVSIETKIESKAVLSAKADFILLNEDLIKQLRSLKDSIKNANHLDLDTLLESLPLDIFEAKEQLLETGGRLELEFSSEPSNPFIFFSTGTGGWAWPR
jgi:hypothetical protein